MRGAAAPGDRCLSLSYPRFIAVPRKSSTNLSLTRLINVPFLTSKGVPRLLKWIRFIPERFTEVYYIPTVLVWSADGQSLFFTLQATADGCGDYLARFYSGLRQLDLASGEVAELDFAGIPSPDGTMVAQMGWEPAAAILIHHLDTNTTTTYTWETSLERDNVAHNMRLVWSPDSRAMALEYATGTCFQVDLYSLLYLDLRTGEEHTLVRQEGQALAIVDWSTPDEIYLREGESSEPVERINVKTGERTPLE